MICKNCGHDFNGNFCNNCGQKLNTKRISYNYVIDEISNNILQVNRGILFTIKELSIRPGHSIREFLNGKRKQHFKPLAFVLLVSAIYSFITFFLGENTFLGNAFSGMTSTLTDSEIEGSVITNILNWCSNNFGYSTVLLLPFFAFASHISFKSEKYNFFEHLVLNCFITGQQIIVYLIFVLLFVLFKVEGYYVQIIPFIIAILYSFWTFNQFFNKRKMFSKTLLTVVTYIINFTLLICVCLIIGIIEGIVKG